MALLSRLAGALLVEEGTECWLVGDTKRPCDWQGAGFEVPLARDPLNNTAFQLVPLAGRAQAAGLDRGPSHRGPWLCTGAGGSTPEDLCRALHGRLLIERNGSVSERLWDLIVDNLGLREGQARGPGRVDWLLATPSVIWDIVRESVLRCA